MADEDKGISRRKFVVGAAAGVAAAAAVGSVGTYLLKPTPAAVTTTETQTQTTTQTTTVQPGLPSSWDYTADVVVVGGGIAGLSASIEARKAGASVILLEKEAAVGGATIMSGGLVYAAGTSVQQKFGITDTAAAMIAHYTHAARGRADTNQIAIAANTSAGNIDWLIQQGATFPAAPTVSGAEVCEGQPAIPRVHAVYTSNGKTSGGPAVIAVLKPAAQNAGVQIMTGTAAQSLIVRGAKEVVGVVAQTGSSTINVKANKGVILAAGGFQSSKAMQIRFSGKAYNTLPLGPTGLNGDGIMMGLALAADTVAIDEILGAPGVMPPGQTSAMLMIVPEFLPAPAIRVNNLGFRYSDETIYYEHQNEELLRQEDYRIVGPTVVYTIFDSATLAQLGGYSFIGSFSKDLSTEVKNGLVMQADTIADLASAIAALPANIGSDGKPLMVPSNLEATIASWNTYSQNGKDLDFGRTAGLGPISTPPYYAILTYSTMFDTSGGLKINGNAQVIDTNGKVIPRLYAAGTNSGGVIGEYYPGSGTALNQGLTFGRIAGVQASGLTTWT